MLTKFYDTKCYKIRMKLKFSLGTFQSTAFISQFQNKSKNHTIRELFKKLSLYRNSLKNFLKRFIDQGRDSTNSRRNGCRVRRFTWKFQEEFLHLRFMQCLGETRSPDRGWKSWEFSKGWFSLKQPLRLWPLVSPTVCETFASHVCADAFANTRAWR